MDGGRFSERQRVQLPIESLPQRLGHAWFAALWLKSSMPLPMQRLHFCGLIGARAPLALRATDAAVAAACAARTSAEFTGSLRP